MLVRDGGVTARCSPDSSALACVNHASAGIATFDRSRRNAMSRDGVRSPESQRLTTPGLTPRAVARSSWDHSSFVSRARSCSAAVRIVSAMSNLLTTDNYLSSVNVTHPPQGTIAAWQHASVKPFREKLRDYMDAAEMNQAELAYRVRVTEGVVSRTWLKKGKLPNVQQFLAIVKVLNIADPWALIGSSFEEPKPQRKVAPPGRRPKDATLATLEEQIAITPRKRRAAGLPSQPKRPTRRAKGEPE